MSLYPPKPHHQEPDWKLLILSSSGIKADCHLWWTCDQQQLQVWGYLSKVWPGECASEILLLIFAFEVMCQPSWKCPFLLSPCRLQRKSCLGTWKRVLPFLSSWSFWATRLSFMTLKGSDTFQFNFFPFLSAVCLFNSLYSAPSHVCQKAGHHSLCYWSKLALNEYLKKRFRVSWYL